MELATFVDRLRSGASPKFPQNANSLEFAQSLDSQDKLSHLRNEFNIPTKASLKKKALDGSVPCKSSCPLTPNLTNPSLSTQHKWPPHQRPRGLSG